MLDSTPPELIGKTVNDVVVRLPKTLPVDTTVAHALACFADDHVHMLLLTQSGRLMGTLLRSDLRPDTNSADLALTHARMSGRTIAADTPADHARRLLLARGQRRLAVIDERGDLIGLLCLKRRHTGFCSDTDVAARAAERAAGQHDSSPGAQR